MRSLENEKDRVDTNRRLGLLSAESKPTWGRMNAGQMLCHVSSALRMALGELVVRPHGRTAFHRFPLKHLLLYVVPIPKGVPTAPELLATAPGDFETDRRQVRKLIGRFAIPRPAGGPEHPLFGSLTGREWAVLQWRHTDHHLKQFGL